jgi:predicted AAA+ superfamily ATPase
MPFCPIPLIGVHMKARTARAPSTPARPGSGGKALISDLVAAALASKPPPLRLRFSTRVHRRRAAPPKLVTLNNALLSAMHPAGPPDPAREPERFGFWVENACLAFGVNQGQRVTYWREEPLEIDAVFEGSWGEWAIEVKTGRFDAHSLKGLLEFCRRNPKFTPLVISAPNNEEIARRHGIRGISWENFLVSGPPPR